VIRVSALPSLEHRTPSTAFSDTADTRLGRAIAPRVAAHPGHSGIWALPDARDAFAARALLARAAERSLDVQYYIWRKDMTGTLLLDSLLAAAGRGVRVRLLLDDNNTSGLDTTLAVLDSHPNIEVRLFNPFVMRKPRALGYLTDFTRLNRRMHNKSFTADNQATIIGGRNVGDEYFGATHGVLFADLDVLAVGPVVDEVSNSFDRYWVSGSSYPAEWLLSPVSPDQIADVAEAASQIERSPAAFAYTSALRDSSFVHDLIEGTLELEWAVTRMVSDNPAKGLGRAAPETLLFQELKRALGDPVTGLELVSPYFVPTATGVAWFTALAKRGVEIKVLTNSLEATDVAFVHAGYAKRRKPLLKAGITLYELRRAMTTGPGPEKRAGSMGSSGSSLHAKTFSADRARVFIGSFNFDPRSATLNTEMGFIIESPALAVQIDTTFRSRVPMDAYEVRLAESGQLFWVEPREGESLRHDREPGTSLWRRAWVRFLSALPIEWLL
jgi:putative cardiolipin synthase